MENGTHTRLEHREVRNRAVKGVFWSYGAYAIQFAAQAVALVILARQLEVSDFGVFAIGLMIVGVGETMFRMGLEPSIVQLKNLHDDHIDVAWTSNLLMSLVAVVVLAAGTIIFAGDGATAEAAKFAVLVMLGTVLLNSLRSPGLMLIQRNMETRDFVFISTTRILIRYFGAIVLAFWLKNYWALVIAFVAGHVAEVVMSYLIAGRRPRFLLRKSVFLELFHFSRWLHLKNVLRWGARYFDQFAVGALLGTSTLGVYNRALNLAGLPNQQTELLSHRIFFPMFASAQNRPDQLRRLVAHAMNVLLITALPVLLVMALHGPFIIRIVLGEKWSAAGSVLGLLSLGLLLRSFNDVQGTALRAVGESRFEFVISAVQVGMTGLLLFPCVLWRGIEGAGIALIMGSAAALIVTEWFMHRRLGVTLVSQAASVGGGIAGAVAAFAVHNATGGWGTSVGIEVARGAVELAAFFSVQGAMFLIARKGVLRTVWWAGDRLLEAVRLRWPNNLMVRVIK